MFGSDLIPVERWNYRVGDALRSLQAAVTRAPDTVAIAGIGAAVPVRSGRAGIVLALHALRLQRGAHVGVPLYCCPVVFKAIVAAGCVPRFVDIDPATLCVSAVDVAAKAQSIDALIAVHMFGNVCDVPAVRRAAPGVPIVEDCAQSLGSALGGRTTGTLGDVAVFSFRAGKYVSAGEGGAVSATRASVRERLRRLAGDLPAANAIGEAVHVLRSFTRAALRSRPLYGLIGRPLWQAYNRSAVYEAKSPIALTRAFGGDLLLSTRRLPGVDAAIATRRAHAARFESALNGHALAWCREPPSAFYNRYQFPVLSPSPAHRDDLAARLSAHRIDSSTPYTDIAAVAASHYDYAGDCPVSEDVARRILVAPTHEGLTRSELERIVRVMSATDHPAVDSTTCAARALRTS